MYLSNKYTNYYNSIIARAKSRASTRQQAKRLLGYVECHHIIPRAIGGTNEIINLVFLSGREHFICHRLLTKITTGKALHQMHKAIHMMTVKTKHQTRHKITSRLFGQLKRQASLSMSILTKGKPKHTEKSRAILSAKAKGRPSPNKGKPMSEEQKLKLSLTKKGTHQSPETIARQAASRTGQKRTEETKRKMSESNARHWLGKTMSDETKQKISTTLKGRKPDWLIGKPANNRGIPHSLETKEKLSIAAINRKRVTCPHCKKDVQPSMFARWHGEKCKHR